MHRPIVRAVLLPLLVLALAGCDGTDAPTVSSDDLEATPDAIATGTAEDPSPSPAEVVATPDDDPTAVATASEGPSEEPRTFEEACAGREDEAFIEVLTPLPDADVGDPFTVTGCGNTFEGTYLYRVELPDGTVVAEGFGTMSCGTGCVGEFEQEVEVGHTGDVTLVVYESSAKDNSEEHVVEVPLTIS